MAFIDWKFALEMNITNMTNNQMRYQSTIQITMIIKTNIVDVELPNNGCLSIISSMWKNQ